MKKNQLLLLITIALFSVTSSCKKDDPIIKKKPGLKGKINPVSQFVYDGLSSYYFWSDEVVSKKPTPKDSDPEEYFYSLRNKVDAKKGWSWITDDAAALVADFAGESLGFGYSIGKFIQIADGSIYAILEYVFANTPASEAGLERLDLIGEIDGQPITADSKGYISKRDINILLYGNKSAKFTIYRFTDDGGVEKTKEVQITPTKINTDPVLFNKVFSIGDKKIGYLFYTGFISNYNHRLFEVFSDFKNKGVTDLVLDLRYNPGGGISAAAYLVSLFAPKEAVESKQVLTTLAYNEYINNIFDKKGWNRSSRLGAYQTKDIYNDKGELIYKAERNPLDANLNLNKVYIIATDRSASASELTTFCSRAIMGDANVIHIGDTTSGKYTASWTIHPYDDEIGQPVYKEESLSAKDKNTFKQWAMQPIVAIYRDKDDKDFINPGYLEPNYLIKEGFGYVDLWKPLGDPKDALLGQALYLITGDESYKPVPPAIPARTRSSQIQLIQVANSKEEAQPLRIDNIKLTPEDFEKIRNAREQ